MTSRILIEVWRPGRVADAVFLAQLVTQLGYPTDTAAMQRQLDRLIVLRQAIPVDYIVARDADAIVGLASVAALDRALEIVGLAEIRALVVHEAYRGQGIGERLVDAARVWAVAHGCERVWLRTNEIRTDAHRFYERLGFSHTKTSRTYTIDL